MMHELGTELGVTPRYVTALVDGLERDGLMRRRPHPDDRRAILVELTEEGKRVSTTIGDRFTEANAELLTVLTPAQQRELLQCLDVLLGELREHGFDAERRSSQQPQPSTKRA